MNNTRRKQIEKLTAQIEEIKETIESLRDEEQDAFDNLPESLQGGERGEKMESAIDALDYAADDLQHAEQFIEESKPLTWAWKMIHSEYKRKPTLCVRCLPP